MLSALLFMVIASTPPSAELIDQNRLACEKIIQAAALNRPRYYPGPPAFIWRMDKVYLTVFGSSRLELDSPRGRVFRRYLEPNWVEQSLKANRLASSTMEYVFSSDSWYRESHPELAGIFVTLPHVAGKQVGTLASGFVDFKLPEELRIIALPTAKHDEKVTFLIPALMPDLSDYEEAYRNLADIIEGAHLTAGTSTPGTDFLESTEYRDVLRRIDQLRLLRFQSFQHFELPVKVIDYRVP